VAASLLFTHGREIGLPSVSKSAPMSRSLLKNNPISLAMQGDGPSVAVF
jgi:hypothetical protein